MIIIKKLQSYAIIFSLCFFSYEAMAVEACQDLDADTINCVFNNDSDAKTSGLAVTGNKALYIIHEVTNGTTKINAPISTQNGYSALLNEYDVIVPSSNHPNCGNASIGKEQYSHIKQNLYYLEMSRSVNEHANKAFGAWSQTRL